MAHARELPGSLGRDDDRPRPQADKIPLSADYQFPAEVIEAARAGRQKLSEADITRALTGFRKLAGEGQDTPASWARRGGAYLAKVEAKPNPDEIVHAPNGDFWYPVKRSSLKPWQVYRDAAGVYHNKPKGSAV